jgi:hypothetical protein
MIHQTYIAGLSVTCTNQSQQQHHQDHHGNEFTEDNGWCNAWYFVWICRNILETPPPPMPGRDISSSRDEDAQDKQASLVRFMT